MDALPRSLRHRPTIVLHVLNRAPQSRLYTKETLRILRNGSAILPAPNSKKVDELDSEKASRPIAFGKPREMTSNVAKSERLKESRRTEKALLHEHHGESIYAYAHLKTGQVVYSLSRFMNVCDTHKSFFTTAMPLPSTLNRDDFANSDLR